MIRWPEPAGVRILARLIEKERFDRKVAEAVERTVRHVR